MSPTNTSGNPSGDRWQDRRSWAETLTTPLLILAGKDAASSGDLLVADAVASVLGERAAGDGRRGVALALAEVAAGGLRSLWEHGWQPVELVRAVRRNRSGRHGDLLISALAAPAVWSAANGAGPPGPWAAQLAELDIADRSVDDGDWLGPWAKRTNRSFAEALTVALELLAGLAILPPLELVLPAPSHWAGWDGITGHRTVDDAVLTKVRALLAKAESTSFEAEAEALTEKAQTLMARHAIDDAVARQAEPVPAGTPGARRFSIDDPYASAKSTLLSGVAAANGGRCVWRPDLALMTVVAHETELAAIDTLFTSLLVQADRALLAEGRVVDRRGRSRTRSFRQSFLISFAERIRERLTEAASTAADEAASELGTSLVPVLARRQEEVDDAVDRMFGKLTRRRGPRVTSREGWVAGRTAADLARLGPETPLTTGR